MSFPSARFISLEKSKKQGFWRQRQRRDLAPAQAIGLGLGQPTTQALKGRPKQKSQLVYN